MPFLRNVPGSGPSWQNNVYFEDLSPSTHWVFLQEELERKHDVFFLPSVGNATLGKVLKVGPDAASAGVQPGDEVVYDEWMGGRWVFLTKDGEEQKALIISLENLSVVVRA